MTGTGRMELVCPAGTPATLRAAVEAGADAVYCGFRNETNARNFPGLNFSPQELAEGVRFAHDHGARVLVAINTFARVGDVDLWRNAVDTAVRWGADAIIAGDIAVLDHVSRNHRDAVRLHLSVQAAASTPEAIGFYARTFGVRRVVIPRVLSVQEITALNKNIDVETEAFVFGGLCVMAEGRCSLSSWTTGLSPNMNGVCSPASHVSYETTPEGQDARLGGVLIHRTPAGGPAPYPTICKGAFTSPDGAGGRQTGHIFEDPVSLDATFLIPMLQKAGVRALKIEGRQRSRAYVAQVVRTFRAAVEAADRGAEMPVGALAKLTEGQASTTGSYAKIWR